MLKWLKNHKLSLLFLVLILALAGIVSCFRVPVALFPNIEFPRIVVRMDAGNKPVPQMVIAVTKPIEQVLQSVPNIVSLRSLSSLGSADFSINFNCGTNMTLALLQVEAAVNQVLPDLPIGTHFIVTKMTPSVMPMMGVSLTSAKLNLIQLSNIANYQIKPQLVTIPGVERIEILGSRTAEYQVMINPDLLRAYGLSYDDVVNALSANNVVSAIGKIEDHYRLYLVEVDSQFKSIDALDNTILKVTNNRLIRLHDVARVQLGSMLEWNRVTANGKNAVLINIMQRPGANTLAIAAAVHTALNQYARIFHNSVSLNVYYDQSNLVRGSAVSVRNAIIIGSLLAGIVLLLFLQDLRMTFIVAIILPCVLAITVLLLNALNITFNIMSLGGMAAAVGLIIDDGIVLLEYIIRRISELKISLANISIYDLALEMLRPFAGSSLATIIIFLPMAFISGVTGSFFKVLAVTMASALTISFFVVLILVPLLFQVLIKPKEISQFIKPKHWLVYLYPYYTKSLTLFCKKPQWLAVLLLGLLAVGLLSYSQVGTGFMPYIDEGGFVLDYRAPSSTSLTETNRLLTQVEQIIIANPYVDSYTRRTGLQLGGGITEANSGDFFIHLKTGSRPNIATIMAEIRNQVQSQVPSLQVDTAQLMEDLIGDLAAVPQPIEIKIFTDDPKIAKTTANIIATKIKSIPGVVEVHNGIVITGDTLIIHLDTIKAVLSGIDAFTATQQLQKQLDGAITGSIIYFDKPINIRVKSNFQFINQLPQINSLLLFSANGNVFPLSRIASLTIVPGQTEISRENMRNIIAVTARIENRDLGSTMQDVKRVVQQIKLPANVAIEYGGLYQQQQQSFHDLVIVFFSAVLLVIFLLMFLYEKIKIVASILITALFSVCGVFLGLWLTGTELNISSMMGLTMIIGIVTETAIFYFTEVEKSETHNLETLINAGTIRMRPILMTALVAILALMPLAMGLGGKSMESDLAIAIISGLILSLPLILIFMPSLYYYISQHKK